MNITNIIETLQKKLDTNSALDLMSTAKILERLKVGAVINVDSVNDLPEISEDYAIFYIENDREFYYAKDNVFISIIGLTNSLTFAWGNNGYGQLGNESTANTLSPVTVAGGITDWKEISAESNHTAAVTDSGIAYAWGVGSNGQLGNGTTASHSSPVTVIGGITDWKQISAGGYHTAATISSLKTI